MLSQSCSYTSMVAPGPLGSVMICTHRLTSIGRENSSLRIKSKSPPFYLAYGVTNDQYLRIFKIHTRQINSVFTFFKDLAASDIATTDRASETVSFPTSPVVRDRLPASRVVQKLESIGENLWHNYPLRHSFLHILWVPPAVCQPRPVRDARFLGILENVNYRLLVGLVHLSVVVVHGTAAG